MAVPFKSVGEEERKVFEGGGSNSELSYPIRLNMISDRKGGGLSNF